MTINLTADDPADLKSVTYVSITTDEPNRQYQESISRAAPDAKGSGVWRAKDVPAGKFRVQTYLGEDRSTFSVRGERKPGESETTVIDSPGVTTRSLTVTVASPV